ncbi:MAG: hypothetical protein ABFR82_16675 [Nitrospirota bacterium]
MIRSLFLTTITVMVIIGCSETTHDFKIRFSDIQGLRKGNQVFFEETVIGNVKEIEYTDSGNYLVSVSVRKQFASTTTDASKFYIDAEHERSEQKGIRVVQLEKGGNKIEEDTIVEGHTKYAVIYDQFAYQFSKNIYILESGINEFFKELKGFSKNEQIKEIERQLNEIIADLGNMSIEIKNKLEKEILPLLRKKIEELRKSLEKTGEEEELKNIDQKIEVITDRLRV